MKHPERLWITALVLGWLFDFLFWQRIPGINFAIYVVLCVGGSFLVLGMQGLRPAWKSLLLLLPLLFFAAMTFTRQEPMSVFLSVLFTLFSMAMLASSYLGGRWLSYGLTDYLNNSLRLVGSMIARPLIFLSEKKPVPETGAGSPSKPGARQGWKRFWAVLRGLLIAIPVVALFAGLLASADPVFARWLDEFTAIFRLEKLPEYILRLMLILAGAYLLAGSILHAAQKSRDEKLVGEDRPLLPPFLGFTEAAVVLGAVAALFAVFVVIQFQYFFGGQSNIHVAGYTYAEYARRGFGELVAVAFFSLVLFLGLSGIVKREGRAQRGWFAGLGIAVVALVGVILVSAFQRLLLYEAAYGFSRLRTYTHVFMVCLGLLLAAVVVLDLLRRERAFALAALLTAFGFAATLTLLNVDGFIVRQNVERAAQGSALDVAYLASLSADAVPALAETVRSPALPIRTREAAGAALVCMQADGRGRDESGWRSFTLASWWSGRALQSVDLDGYELDEERGSFVVTPGGEQYPCWDSGYSH